MVRAGKDSCCGDVSGAKWIYNKAGAAGGNFASLVSKEYLPMYYAKACKHRYFRQSPPKKCPCVYG